MESRGEVEGSKDGEQRNRKVPLRGECHISVSLELQDPHTSQEDLLRSLRFLAGNLGPRGREGNPFLVPTRCWRWN